MTDTVSIPEGYVMNASGDLIKEDNLTPLQREEDALVKKLWPRAEALHNEMAAFKTDAMNTVAEVLARCVKQHGIKRFERIKGNVSFVTVDGMYKVERAISDKIEANSSIEAARQLFEQYAQVLEQQSGEDAKEFIRDYFRLNKDQYVTSRLVDLCNKNFNHPLYKKARGALQQALFVTGTKAYLRFYKRNKADDSWVAMPLQFSAIPGVEPTDAEAKEPDAKQAEKATTKA